MQFTGPAAAPLVATHTVALLAAAAAVILLSAAGMRTLDSSNRSSSRDKSTAGLQFVKAGARALALSVPPGLQPGDVLRGVQQALGVLGGGLLLQVGLCNIAVDGVATTLVGKTQPMPLYLRSATCRLACSLIALRNNHDPQSGQACMSHATSGTYYIACGALVVSFLLQFLACSWPNSLGLPAVAEPTGLAWLSQVLAGGAAVVCAGQLAAPHRSSNQQLQQLWDDWPAWSATLLLILQPLQQLVSAGSRQHHMLSNRAALHTKTAVCDMEQCV